MKMHVGSWAARSFGFLVIWSIWIFQFTNAQDCSAVNPCTTGCCSEHGYCGIGDDFCGKTCVANCDFKLECDENSPCAEDACCSKSGYCGLGPDFCAPDNCVNNCKAKSECDPSDFGSEFASGDRCPLNVCCSKFGFCGVTEEFCGTKKVKRPSCEGTNPQPRRVVGYYEGWSPSRVCNDFWPEQIPAGRYSHLIYAFAAVDPKTFEVRPASTEEIPYIKRLSALKEYDPDLKVYIALGGWTYNDPGPTQSTFSDLARSDEAQKTFFRSLISFLATYDLDGVDIDWEYPGPHDIVERGGREEDFENFPKFLKNLKEALKSSGSRDGLTITIPGSYWYLQYFDIVELEKHVDWFNVMSYDLHGAWDRGNKWTGNFLNAHTNLTEIKEALDLLWRNDIDPENVVLGLAFYGRAFTATTIACLDPGCTFESAANKGLCSRENGILLYSEIMEFIDEHSLTPKHYEDEAVKVVYWGDQWVGYDDQETLKQKLDFALGQCLGGVMVWAVSHDTADAELSKALGMLTNRQGQSLVTIGDSDNQQVRKYVDQCKWTNCGVTCPAGYASVERDDRWRHSKGELMLDSTGCVDGEGDHHLCCPKEDMPSCGWYSHWNGKCDSKCPDGYIEIGSLGSPCEKDYQAACCTTGKRSMELWDTCTWSGDYEDCSAVCPPVKITEILTSVDGSGGVSCKDDKERKYCCDRTYEKKKWGQCTYEYYYNSFIQFEDNPSYCSSACPDNQYRVAMDGGGICEGVEGSASQCCDNDFFDYVSEEKPEVTELKEKMHDFVESPICLAEWHDNDPLITKKKRTTDDMAARIFVKTTQRILEAPFFTFEIEKDIVHYNEAVVPVFPNLEMPGFKDYLVGNYSDFYRKDKVQLSEEIACDLERWNDLASDEPVLSCPVDYCNDLGHGCTEEGADPATSCEGLTERANSGNQRWPCLQRADGTGYNLHSSRYPSAGDWDPDDETRTRGVILYNRPDCTSADVRRVFVPADGLIVNGRGMSMHTEHPVEINTVITFLNDAAVGRLSDRPQDANAFPAFPDGFFEERWFTGNSVPPSIWGLPPGGFNTPVPYVRLYETIGSGTNRDCFFIVQAAINYAKSDAWRWRARNLLPDDDMEPLVAGTNSWKALHRIRLVFAAFRYMDGEEVRDCIIEISNNFRHELRLVNRAWNVEHVTERFDARPVWDRWIRHHFERMVANAQQRITHWLDRLDARWANGDDRLSRRTRADISRLRGQVETRIRFRTDGLEDEMEVDDEFDPVID